MLVEETLRTCVQYLGGVISRSFPHGATTERGAVRTVELGAVHCLSDGDPATSPTCHHIPCHQMEDQEAPKHLGGRKKCHAGRGYCVHVRRVPHCRPERGDGRAPGANVPQPGAPQEAPDGGEVDQ